MKRRYSKLDVDDDPSVPNREDRGEPYTYSGPKYPDDDSGTPNRTVIRYGRYHVYGSNGKLYRNGVDYIGPKYPD